jgi:hypothetical protein
MSAASELDDNNERIRAQGIIKNHLSRAEAGAIIGCNNAHFSDGQSIPFNARLNRFPDILGSVIKILQSAQPVNVGPV